MSFKSVLLAIILLLLIMPAAILCLNISDGKLYVDGDFKKPEKASWWDGTKQNAWSEQFEKSFIGRGAAVRTNNQLIYSLLGVANNREVLAGKNDELFHKGFFRKQSQNIRWKEQLPETFKNLEIISDYLESRGKKLWIVLAPEKASFMPEALPWYVSKNAVENRPYLYFAELLKQTKLHYTDLSEYSRREGAETHGRVFPKTGMHWSTLEAAEGFKKWIEDLNQATDWHLPTPIIDSIEITSDPVKQETDLWKLSHLWLLPELDPAPIPHIAPSQPSTIRVRGVGDSFYFTWEALGLIENTFEKSEYWFYNQELMDRAGSREFMENYEIMEKIEGYDLVVLMAHEGNIIGMPFGFDTLLKRELMKAKRIQP